MKLFSCLTSVTYQIKNPFLFHYNETKPVLDRIFRDNFNTLLFVYILFYLISSTFLCISYVFFNISGYYVCSNISL